MQSYSHVNYSYLFRSWFDPCAVSERFYDSISCCEVTEDFSTSDHCPLKFTLDTSYFPTVITDDSPKHRIKRDLSKGTHEERFSDKLGMEL